MIVAPGQGRGENDECFQGSFWKLNKFSPNQAASSFHGPECKSPLPNFGSLDPALRWPVQSIDLTDVSDEDSYSILVPIGHGWQAPMQWWMKYGWAFKAEFWWRLWAEVWSRYWNQSLVETLMLNFSQLVCKKQLAWSLVEMSWDINPKPSVLLYHWQFLLFGQIQKRSEMDDDQEKEG